MPAYAFEGAIALVAVVLVDATVLVIDWTRQRGMGAIRLPNSSPDDHVLEEKDPFDITAPLDYENGEAINEKLFWTKASFVYVCGS